jgi:hypothetical protein
MGWQQPDLKEARKEFETLNNNYSVEGWPNRNKSTRPYAFPPRSSNALAPGSNLPSGAPNLLSSYGWRPLIAIPFQDR